MKVRRQTVPSRRCRHRKGPRGKLLVIPGGLIRRFVLEEHKDLDGR